MSLDLKGSTGVKTYVHRFVVKNSFVIFAKVENGDWVFFTHACKIRRNETSVVTVGKHMHTSTSHYWLSRHECAMKVLSSEIHQADTVHD